jgi:hypothetical protein
MLESVVQALVEHVRRVLHGVVHVFRYSHGVTFVELLGQGAGLWDHLGLGSSRLFVRSLDRTDAVVCNGFIIKLGTMKDKVILSCTFHWLYGIV